MLSATPRSDIEFLETREGVLAAQIREHDEFLTSDATSVGRARALCSRRTPRREAEQIAESIDFRQMAAVAIAGFGMGYLPGAVARTMKRSGVIVIFEPDLGLLRAILERIDHSEWMNESNIVILTDPEDAAAMSAALTGVEGIVMMGLTLLEHPACAQRLGQARSAFYTKFQQVVQAVRTMVATTLVQVDTTVRNLISNIGYYTSGDGIAELADIAKGKHAIVVSAGPSLERNIEELTRPGVREKCVIIAAQTVLKPLLRRGIKPHFVTALDHSDISARFYEGLTAKDVEGVTLLIEPKCSPAIPRAFPGVIRCAQDRFLDSLLGDSLRRPMGQIPAGATVAHLAYYLARHLGCDPVVLIGQDLGFTDGQYYSSGAAIHDVWACELSEFNTLEMMEWSRVKRMGRHLRKAIGIDGEPIYTDEQMSTYLVQFERDFAKDAERGLKIIDATEGGVLKAHTSVETLRGVIDRVLAGDNAPIELLGGAGTPSAATPADPVLERLDVIRADLNRVSDVCAQTSVQLAEMLEHQADQERVNRLIDKIESLRDQIESIDPAYRLVHFHNQAGAFHRIRSDRAIQMDASLAPMERQRLAIERDARNVTGLRNSTERIDAIIKDAVKVFEKESSSGLSEWWDDDGEVTDEAVDPSLGANHCFSTIDDMDEEPATAAAPVIAPPLDAASPGAAAGGDITRVSVAPSVWAVVPLNLSEGVTGMKYRPALESLGAELVVQRTLTRLSCVRNIRGIVLLSNRPGEAQRLADGANQRKPITIQPVDQFRTPIMRDRIRAARAWSRTCWRGGLSGATCYDEVFHPVGTHEALKQGNGTAALIAGPDWCFIDPRLCEQIVDRYLEDPVSRRMTFSMAAPGLAGCVLERSLLASMSDAITDSRWVAPIGRALSYLPTSPVLDPTCTVACVPVSARVRDCGLRFIADTEVTRARLERMWQGLAGMFMEPMSDYIAEAVRIDAERYPDALPDEVIADMAHGMDASWIHWVIESLAAGAMGRALSIHSDGVRPDLLVEMIQHAKERRVNIHVRVPATVPLDRLRSLLVAGPEVISLDFVLDTQPHPTGGTLESHVMLDELRDAAKVCSTLLRDAMEGSQVDHGSPATWIVPRIVRGDRTRTVIERFFDTWIGSAGVAVIDAINPANVGPDARIRPMPLPRSYRRRLSRSRLCITDAGDALVDPLGADSSTQVGNVATVSLEECWALAQKLRREQGSYA